MANTKIEWADKSWNPITGLCTPISPGCDNCYARKFARRLQAIGNKKWQDLSKFNLYSNALLEPFNWKKPQRIFVCSMIDLFHKDIDDCFIDRIIAIPSVLRRHTFLVLTKRLDRALSYFSQFYEDGHHVWRGNKTFLLLEDGQHWPLSNVWLGVTAENQDALNTRGKLLMQIPAAKRFISYEPALDTLDIGPDAAPYFYYNDLAHGEPVWRGPDWFACGGETGPKARPMHPDWPRKLRDDCQAAGVPFFFKSWGDWAPLINSGAKHPTPIVFWRDGAWHEGLTSEDTAHMARIGKKRAGRLLDGREWNEMPVTGDRV